MASSSVTPASKWSDLGLRSLSAAVLIPAVIADVWVGGAWFSLLVALLGVLVAFEWTTIVHRQDALQFALHALAALCAVLLPPTAGLAAIGVVWIVSAALAMVKDGAGFWRFLGVPYASVPGIALVLLRNDAEMGALAILWVMATVWAADTLAYFAGRIIGGPKLAPVLSPKKTWAGLGGAIAGSAAASVIFASLAGLRGIVALALLAGALAVVEQGGDLFKSAMKRHFGVKDSGHIIPGHGGIIDRVDGLMAVAVAAAIIGWLRSGPGATAVGLLVW